MENVDTRNISSKKLFDELKNTGHMCDYVEFIIDPDSMLLPSLEIQKQTFMALFPVITNQITLIYSMRNQDPEAAASQLMALEKLLDIQNQDIYDYISKSDYDAIMAKKPSIVQQQMQQVQMENAARETAMQTMAGGSGSSSGGGAIGNQMASDGQPALQPQNPNEMARPQSPMMSAVDSSLGQMANLPMNQ